MTGSACSVPRVLTVPVSSRNSRPSAGGPQVAGGEHAQHVAVRDQRDVAAGQQGSDPGQHAFGPLGDLLDGLARVRGVPGITPSRHRYQPGLVSWICGVVSPS
jgi:hypothetical protein